MQTKWRHALQDVPGLTENFKSYKRKVNFLENGVNLRSSCVVPQVFPLI